MTARRPLGTVGADLRRKPTAGKGPDLGRYPYATCELGGGVQVTYHRRPRVTADDVAALALTKIGCGSAWQGYYMYQGGSNVMDVAPMPLVAPDHSPEGLDDRDTLRWAVRTDGTSGMLFVNTYQPGGEDLSAHSGVRFRLDGPTGPLELPTQAVEIPSGSYFAWPFRWPLPVTQPWNGRPPNS